MKPETDIVPAKSQTTTHWDILIEPIDPSTLRSRIDALTHGNELSQLIFGGDLQRRKVFWEANRGQSDSLMLAEY
jgi:hypothetical protein